MIGLAGGVQIYPWLVVLHVAAVLTFVFAHGTAGFISFRLRGARNVEHVIALMDTAEQSNGLMYPSLYILLIAGIVAGVVGGWLGQGWIWAALVLLIAVTVAMYAVATPYYRRLREALGLRPRRRGSAPGPRAPDAEIMALLDSRRPEILAAIGAVGLLLILWLMIMKPF